MISMNINIMGKRKRMVCLAVFLFILAIVPAVIFASISVTPTLYELQIPGGKSFTDAIRVVNVGKAEITVKVYLSDFDFYANGDIRFADAGTGPYSLSDYLRVNPTSIQLQPGEDKFVRFTITIPENLTGEYNGILFFETLPKGIKSPAPGKQVMVSTRIGAGIYTAIKNTASSSSEIADIFFKQTPAQDKSSFQYALIYHNNGNIHLRPTGKVKIIDAAGKELTSTQVNENKTSVLRDSYRIFTGDFINKPGFDDGNYKIVAQIDYGKEILEVEKPVSLVNTGGITSFTAKIMAPAKENKGNEAAKIVFSAASQGIEPGKENQQQQKIFRLKSAQGELLVTVPARTTKVKKTQSEEYMGEWAGQLKPGLYIAEFLISARENETLTSFQLIDNMGSR